MSGSRAKIIRRAAEQGAAGRRPDYARFVYRRAKRAWKRARRG